MRKFVIILAGAFALAGLSLFVSSFTAPMEGGTVIMVSLTGAQEAPGPGDSDGSGTATFILNSGRGTIEYNIAVSNIAPATAAHIHIAPEGSPGPVVVGLNPPTNGTSTGIAQVSKGIIKEIRKNPSAYYVNVHNSEYPGGAVRGQLSD